MGKLCDSLINAINASKLDSTLFRKFSFPRVNLDCTCQSSFSNSDDRSREMGTLFKYFKKQSLPSSNEAELPDASMTILELRLELCMMGLWRQESVNKH